MQADERATHLSPPSNPLGKPQSEATAHLGLPARDWRCLQEQTVVGRSSRARRWRGTKEGRALERRREAVEQLHARLEEVLRERSPPLEPAEPTLRPPARHVEERVRLVRPVHLRVPVAKVRGGVQRACLDGALAHGGAGRIRIKERLARGGMHDIVERIVRLQRRRRPVGDDEGALLGERHVEGHDHSHQLVADAIWREGRKPDWCVEGAWRTMPRLEPLIERRALERGVANVQEPLPRNARVELPPLALLPATPSPSLRHTWRLRYSCLDSCEYFSHETKGRRTSCGDFRK